MACSGVPRAAKPANVSMESARQEADEAFAACVQDALDRTGRPLLFEVLCVGWSYT